MNQPLNPYQKEELGNAVSNAQAATEIAVRLKTAGSTQEVRELAAAVHYVAFAVQQVALNARPDSFN